MKTLTFTGKIPKQANLSLRMITKRHHIKFDYNSRKQVLSLIGDPKSFQSLKSDRGWNQFIMMHHLNQK